MRKQHLLIPLVSLTLPLSALAADTGTKPNPSTQTSPITLGYTVPADVANGTAASKKDFATFAWEEFVALNWAAAPNDSIVVGDSAYFRGKPDTSSTLASVKSGDTRVWHTYHHRVELYPSNPPATLPSINAQPSYSYPSYVTITPANAETQLTLFNNLDEASEIGLNFMYHKPFAEAVNALIKQYPTPTPAQQQEITAAAIKAGIVYEAKANPVIYDYVGKNGYQVQATRNAAAANTVKKITNQPYTGNTFELPNGSIEIKATWRRYDSSKDTLDDYIWQDAIYYTGSGTTYTAYNDKMLLLALHIIHKTPSFQQFTFATFEHVGLEQSGFYFTNTNPQTVPASMTGADRALPDPGIIEAKRQFPIPGSSSSFDLVSFNQKVQAQLISANAKVLANYHLIGVQAETVDAPTTNVPEQEFYLSNFATETNDSLQFFHGGLFGLDTNVPDPSLKRVFKLDPATNKYVAHNMGGCQGCHGAQAQFGGFDFSVISAAGNFFVPQGVTPFPGGTAVPQNATSFPLQIISKKGDK